MFNSMFTEAKAKTKREEVFTRATGMLSGLVVRTTASGTERDCLNRVTAFTHKYTHTYCTHNQPDVCTQTRTHTLWKIIATIAMHYHRHSLGK